MSHRLLPSPLTKALRQLTSLEHIFYHINKSKYTPVFSWADSVISSCSSLRHLTKKLNILIYTSICIDVCMRVYTYATYGRTQIYMYATVCIYAQVYLSAFTCVLARTGGPEHASCPTLANGIIWALPVMCHMQKWILYLQSAKQCLLSAPVAFVFTSLLIIFRWYVGEDSDDEYVLNNLQAFIFLSWFSSVPNWHKYWQNFL